MDVSSPDRKKAADGVTQVILGLSAVVVSVQEAAPKVLIVRGAQNAVATGLHTPEEEGDALPFGPFDPDRHETIEAGLRQWVAEQTPIRPGYVEQLYTFGNRGRYAGQRDETQRVVSVGYLALTQHGASLPTAPCQAGQAFWGDWYDYFPWEDWRRGRPSALADVIAPGLRRWVSEAGSHAEEDDRRARVDICFGLNGAEWDEEKVLERYELLYTARLVYEAVRDKGLKAGHPLAPGRSMLYDHRRILATAMGRLRGKLKYRPVVFELVPEAFTLLQLQKTVEAIAGHPLHKQNFRRLVESTGLVEEIPGKKSSAAGGRPAALFRFRHSVLLERPAPGVRLSPASGEA